MTLTDEIENIILSGELPAGAKLDEMVLAKRFKVSRTPVREALRQLASAGLVDLIPNRGAFTATLTEDRLRELFVAMAELEATCARLAAISMTPVERHALSRLHSRMGETVAPMPENIREFGEMNDAFHVLLYRGAHNHFLEDTTSSLRKRLSLYRRSQFRTGDRLRKSFAEHAEVVKAVISGDAERAHAAMLHHVDQVENSVQMLLKEIKGSQKGG